MVTKDPQKLVKRFFKEMTNEELTEKQNQWLTETLQELTETE